MYIPLTTHSAYSLQEVWPCQPNWYRAALADGLPALGLTDHRLLTGAVEFVQACRKVGIAASGSGDRLGERPLALLAMSLSGWSSLCALSSALALRSDPVATCPLDLLAANSRDLIAITGEQGDPLGDRSVRSRISSRVACTCPCRIQPKPCHYPTWAASYPCRWSFTHPVYYLTPEQATLQRTLSAIRLNLPLETSPGRSDRRQSVRISSVHTKSKGSPRLPGRPDSQR